MRTIVYLSVALACARVCVGDNIVTSDGVTYEDARITRSDPSSVEIVHRSGIARVSLSRLPEKVQQQYGYDASKAAAYAAAAQSNAVLTVRPVLVARDLMDRIKEFERRHVVCGVGMVTAKLENGVVFDGLYYVENCGGNVGYRGSWRGYRDGTFNWQTPSGTRVLERYVTPWWPALPAAPETPKHIEKREVLGYSESLPNKSFPR